MNVVFLLITDLGYNLLKSWMLKQKKYLSPLNSSAVHLLVIFIKYSSGYWNKNAKHVW